MKDARSSSNAERALEILLILGDATAEGFSLAQISERLGCAKSVAHRSLSALRAKGFAETAGRYGHYRLGPSIPALTKRQDRLEPRGAVALAYVVLLREDNAIRPLAQPQHLARTAGVPDAHDWRRHLRLRLDTQLWLRLGLRLRFGRGCRGAREASRAAGWPDGAVGMGIRLLQRLLVPRPDLDQPAPAEELAQRMNRSPAHVGAWC